ncbi:MAG TPA: superoxide dismutase [Verrucomicrobiota bacterium]|nr:superoxide dismutase [Verrucomicrobiota bacterium]
MIALTRRAALQRSLILGATVFINTRVTRALAQAAAPAPTGPFKLAPLPYAFDALEPHIDARTMEIHHDKHQAAYVNNLNKAVADYPELQKMTPEQLVSNLDKVPEKVRTAVRNNAGGDYNHNLFWQCLKKDAPPLEDGPFKEAMGRLFADEEQGKKMFVDRAMGVFGSGWVWISVGKDKELVLETTPNQDTPLALGHKPLYGLDLWEHAYYLKYQNRRIDYIQAAMQVVNWPFLEDRYAKLTA